MDKLTEKQYKQSDYISRYSSFPIYYNTEDKKYVQGTTKQLEQGINYVAHKVTSDDTLASLSRKYYGRPDYYWIIADFNHLQDPFIKLKDKFTTINIPSLSNIYFKD